MRDTTLYLFPNYVKGLPNAWVERTLNRYGYRKAMIEELAAFGARYPLVQSRFDIYATGSSMNGLSPVLYTTKGERFFFALIVDGTDWETDTAFLGVKLSDEEGGGNPR